MTDGPRAAWASEVETHRPIRGRRWRVSDPRIPGPLRQQLVDELMAARRAVRDAGDDRERQRARDRVHDAKVALGERGLPWWSDEPDPSQVADRVVRTARVLGRVDLAGVDVSDAVASVTSQPIAVVRHALEDG